MLANTKNSTIEEMTMRLTKSFLHAADMVLHSRLRSWLTILGIVIGVAAVVSIMSLGSGLQNEIDSQLGALGGDIVTVTAGGSRAASFGPGGGGLEGSFGGGASASTKNITLTRLDVQALKGLSDVLWLDTEIRGTAKVYYLAKQGSVSVTGVDPAAWPHLTTATLATGRFLGPADTNQIVIGGRLANSFFSQKLGVNQLLSIEGRVFRIVGILDDESTSVYMPITSAYDVLDEKESDVYDSLVIKVRDESRLNESLAAMTQKLASVRHVTLAKPDFTVSSNKERQAQRAEMMDSMTMFLTAIAAVALLVGAVGVANTMFTSVLEKTKEIGIMKAVGARNKDILTIFLLNASIIGFIGGALGIVAGYLLSALLPSLMGASSGPLSRLTEGSVITMSSVLFAITISVGIGIVAGLIPAYQASKLKPVDALRYE